MMIESVLMAAIDAKEERGVAMMELSGAFLHAWNDEKVIMFIKGKLAELIINNYEEFDVGTF